MTVNDIALSIDERQVVESCGPPAERKSLGLEALLYYEPCPTVIIDAGRRVLKVLGGDRLRLAGGESLGQDSTIPDLIGCIGPPAGRLIEDETWYYPALRIRVRFAKRGIIYCLGEDPPGPLRPVGIHQDPWTLNSLRLERDMLASFPRQMGIEVDPATRNQMKLLGEAAKELLQDHRASQDQLVEALHRCAVFWDEWLVGLDRGGRRPPD